MSKFPSYLISLMFLTYFKKQADRLMSRQESLMLHVLYSTSAGNSLLSKVCSDPQALLSPQWKWNWHSLNWSCRGPPLSAAAKAKGHVNQCNTFQNPLKRVKCLSSNGLISSFSWKYSTVFASSSKRRKWSQPGRLLRNRLFRLLHWPRNIQEIS